MKSLDTWGGTLQVPARTRRARVAPRMHTWRPGGDGPRHLLGWVSGLKHTWGARAACAESPWLPQCEYPLPLNLGTGNLLCGCKSCQGVVGEGYGAPQLAWGPEGRKAVWGPPCNGVNGCVRGRFCPGQVLFRAIRRSVSFTAMPACSFSSRWIPSAFWSALAARLARFPISSQ